MKRLFLTSLLLMAIHSFAQTTKLHLASDIWPPFTNVEGEKAFAMDLVKEALTRVNIKTKFYIQELNDVIKGIDAGFQSN